jgi:hypothetical protein
VVMKTGLGNEGRIGEVGQGSVASEGRPADTASLVGAYGAPYEGCPLLDPGSRRPVPTAREAERGSPSREVVNAVPVGVRGPPGPTPAEKAAPHFEGPGCAPN